MVSPNFADEHQLRRAAHEHSDDLNEAAPRQLSAEARERLKRTVRNESK